MPSISATRLPSRADDLVNFKPKLAHFVNKPFLDLYKDYGTTTTTTTVPAVIFKSHRPSHIFIETSAILPFLACNVSTNVSEIQLNPLHLSQADNSSILSATSNKRSRVTGMLSLNLLTSRQKGKQRTTESNSRISSDPTRFSSSFSSQD